MLKVRDLTRTFPAQGKEGSAVKAVDGVSFELAPGELFTMLGPSGCGKTTTLRCIAGLENPERGEVMLGSRVLFSSEQKIAVDANDRGLGMVFQSYAIWPHMNVFGNIAFPLQVMPRARRPSRREIAERVDRVLAVVQLDHLADRRATDLSGGQQQRLALARALVVQPPLLLLDEPLSNLDAKLRESMRFELKRLQAELGVTTVYVTHDQSEALAMSDRIAVMRSGQIEQLGTPREIYEAPSSQFVADFIGSSNFIAGKTIGGSAADGYRLETEHGEVTALSSLSLPLGSSIVLAVRPERVDMQPATEGPWLAKVEALAYLGDSVDHLVRLGSILLRVRTSAQQALAEGSTVRLILGAESCVVLEGAMTEAPVGYSAMSPEDGL